MSGFFSGLESYTSHESQQTRNRSEKARLFNEYRDAKIAAGEEMDPTEMDRLRISLAGDDPFMASMIPAGDALKKLTEEANSRAQNSRMKTQTERWAMKDTERTFVQRIVDDNWDKSPEEMGKIFENAFGPEQAPKIYDSYKPELPSMLSESTGKKYAQLRQNPASAYLQTPEHIERFFPAESRSPATRNVLTSIMKDNVRARNQQDFQTGMDIMQKTPDFAVGTPEGRAWWSENSARGMGYSDPSQVPQVFKQGQELAYTQAQSAQQAKVMKLAAEDPPFADAARTGDEDAIFAAVTSLMAQAQMPAPRDKNDPAYLNVKKSLDLVSRTAAVNEDNKKEADLKAAVIQEADEMKKGQKARMEATANATFMGKDFQKAGTSGKDAVVDERIGAAMSLINNDTSFFGSPENIQEAAAFIKRKYLADKKAFDPMAAYAEFMSEGNVEQEASWINRRTSSRIRGNGLLKPGTNFRVAIEKRKSFVTESISEMFSKLNKPTSTDEDYKILMEGKALFISEMRKELNDIRTSINTINNDPAVRSNIVGYDYQSSLRDMEVLERSIQQIEKFNPVPPSVQKSLDESQRSLNEAQARLNLTYQPPRIERDFWGRPIMQGPKQPSFFWGKNKDGIPLDAWGKPLYENAPETVTEIVPMSYDSYYENTGSGYQPVSYQSNARTRIDTYLDAVADAESSGDPFANATTSTAKGLFQFTKGTWDNMVDRYGKRLGIDKNDIYNPAAQRTMAHLLTTLNAEQLVRQTGKDIDEGDLYLAHFLGPSRAATVINNLGTNLLAANLFPDAARANRGIFYKDGVPVTIEQLHQTMSGKLRKKMNERRKKETKLATSDI